MKNRIKEFDKFGHPMTLNFNRKGDTHATMFGGCMSIMVNIAFFTFVFIKFKAMVFKEDNEQI